MYTPAFLLLFALFAAFPLRAQPGCTDPPATNYDPDATSNDGSCVYPVTNYTLPLKATLSTTLNETSGLVMAGGALWSFNDSGNPARIYKIDTVSGAIQQTVTVGGASNVDWEDIAFDGTYFYVGDFGNNANGNRTDLKIYKFPLSAIPSGSSVTVPPAQVQVINYSYEDQSNYNPQGPNNTSFDCESMFFRNGELHLFTKDWINHTTTHYTLPNAAGTWQAANQETYDVNGLVTAADISGPGVVILQGYESSGGDLFFWLLYDYQPGQFFSGNKRRIELGPWVQTGQTEGICFRNGSYGYVSNERVTAAIPARLWRFSVAQWLLSNYLPVELVSFGVRPEGPGALLHWQTATEHANAGFAVERSADGVLFQEIAFVPGAGNSLEYRFYEYFDAPPGPACFYRLRQRDFDGSEQVSQAVAFAAAARACPETMLVAFSGQPIRLPGAGEGAPLGLFDFCGRLVWQGDEGRWPAAGVYTWAAIGTTACRGMVLVR